MSGDTALLVTCQPSTLKEWRSDAEALCSASEWLRADRYRFERLTRRFLSGRSMLRDVLGRIHDLDPRELRLHTEESGRLVSPDTEVELSLSYGHDLVGVLLGQSPLGLDIEHMARDTDIDAVAGHVFRPEEREELERLHDSKRREFFFRVWVEKEAVSKAMGLGLSVGFDAFDARAAALELGGRLETGRLCGDHLSATLVPTSCTRSVAVHWTGKDAADARHS